MGKAYTSYSGADTVAYFDDKVLGELISIEWEKQLGGYEGYASASVKGKMSATVFDRDPLTDFHNKSFDVLLHFLNEYGESKVEYIKGARLEKMVGGMHVDQPTQEFHYEFSAQDVFLLEGEEFLKSAKEQLQFLIENIGRQEKKVVLKLDIYAKLLKIGYERRDFLVMSHGEFAKAVNKEVKEVQGRTQVVQNVSLTVEEAQMEKLSEMVLAQFNKRNQFEKGTAF